MLTEIEWWGGLIFIWWAVNYWVVTRMDSHVNPGMIALHLSLLTTAAALAMYFYPLESNIAKYVFFGVLGVCAVATFLTFVLPGEVESEEKQKEENDEEESRLFDIIGEVVLFFPIFATLVLGGIKSYQLIQEMGWV